MAQKRVITGSGVGYEKNGAKKFGNGRHKKNMNRRKHCGGDQGLQRVI